MMVGPSTWGYYWPYWCKNKPGGQSHKLFWHKLNAFVSYAFYLRRNNIVYIYKIFTYNLQKSEQTYSKKFLEIDSWNYMPGTNTGLFCFTVKVDDDL